MCGLFKQIKLLSTRPRWLIWRGSWHRPQIKLGLALRSGDAGAGDLQIVRLALDADEAETLHQRTHFHCRSGRAERTLRQPSVRMASAMRC